MAALISPAILIAATLASFSLALVLARLGLAAMFRILPAVGPPAFRRARNHAGQ